MYEETKDKSFKQSANSFKQLITSLEKEYKQMIREQKK